MVDVLIACVAKEIPLTKAFAVFVPGTLALIRRRGGTPEILFKENYNKLYVFAYNYLNDKEISEDVVNDAFEYVWRNYD